MTRKVSRRLSLKALGGSCALLLVLSAAIPAAGPLSFLAPVSSALADKGSGGGGDSDGDGGDSDGDGGGDSDGEGDSDGDGSGSGKSGRGRNDDDRSKEAEKAEKAESKSVERFLDRLNVKDEVSWASSTPSSLEVRYADGWTESVKSGRYRLSDTRQRVVTDRPAKKSDIARLSAVAAAAQ